MGPATNLRCRLYQFAGSGLCQQLDGAGFVERIHQYPGFGNRAAASQTAVIAQQHRREVAEPLGQPALFGRGQRQSFILVIGNLFMKTQRMLRQWQQAMGCALTAIACRLCKCITHNASGRAACTAA